MQLFDDDGGHTDAFSLGKPIGISELGEKKSLEVLNAIYNSIRRRVGYCERGVANTERLRRCPALESATLAQIASQAIEEVQNVSKD
jgi:hypothetical protein